MASQLQVDAKAEELFGAGWRDPLQRTQEFIDRLIADRLDVARSALLPSWPGLHAGTGTNDHVHHWELYGHQGRTLRACQVCGLPHPEALGK